jgi:hypothetical protein
VTYVFSPAFKDAGDDSRRPQSRSRKNSHQATRLTQ